MTCVAPLQKRAKGCSFAMPSLAVILFQHSVAKEKFSLADLGCL